MCLQTANGMLVAWHLLLLARPAKVLRHLHALAALPAGAPLSPAAPAFQAWGLHCRSGTEVNLPVSDVKEGSQTIQACHATPGLSSSVQSRSDFLVAL